MAESHARRCQAVQMGSLDYAISRRTDAIGAMLVCHQQQNIRPAGSSLRCHAAGRASQEMATRKHAGIVPDL